MQRKAFHDLVRSGRIFLDGGSGTWLQSHGMPSGVCPEAWALDHPDLPAAMCREYFTHGANIVVTFTFGANEIKLAHYGFSVSAVESLNARLSRIAVDVRDTVAGSTGNPLFVSGDIGPTGRFLTPAGDLEMSSLVEIYRRQVRGLLAGGVDLFSIETMLDLGQTLAALRAVRLECDLPVIATLTFDASGRTLSGNRPLECAVALEAAGADAIGANCSSGPEAMGTLLKDLAGRTLLPIVIKPNAGMPRMEDGKTVFDMTPATFADAMLPLVRQGVGQMVGGCCGTTPEHISALCAAVGDARPGPVVPSGPPVAVMICSARRSAVAPAADAITYLPADDPEILQDTVMDAMADDPEVIGLCFRDSAPKDTAALVEAVGWVQAVCPVPLVFRSEDAVLLEALTAAYPGRAGIVTQSSGDFHWALKLV